MGWLGIACAVAAWGALVGACSGSKTTGTCTGANCPPTKTFDGGESFAVCAEGDTRACLGPGACKGAQSCSADRTGWTACDCGASNTGDASSTVDSGGLGSGGAGGTSGGCNLVSLPTELLTPDLEIVFDESSSMNDPDPQGTSSWTADAQAGVQAFMTNSSFAGAGVGIQYFPLGATSNDECTQDYTTPNVEIAPLPGVAKAINASLAAHSPTFLSPTGAALSGALTHMKTYAGAHPGHAPTVVLITDGYATDCTPGDIPGISNLAKAAAAAKPSVRTFVIGISSVTNLEPIASAGQGQTFYVKSGDIPSRIAADLGAIATPTPACSFSLAPLVPHGAQLDTIQLFYTANATGLRASIPHVASVADCATGIGQGFYFDDPVNASALLLCPTTCAGQSQGVLSVGAGCAAP